MASVVSDIICQLLFGQRKCASWYDSRRLPYEGDSSICCMIDYYVVMYVDLLRWKNIVEFEHWTDWDRVKISQKNCSMSWL